MSLLANDLWLQIQGLNGYSIVASAGRFARGKTLPASLTQPESDTAPISCPDDALPATYYSGPCDAGKDPHRSLGQEWMLCSLPLAEGTIQNKRPDLPYAAWPAMIESRVSTLDRVKDVRKRPGQ